MQKTLHRKEERGVSEHSWLSSRFSFSFAEWYEPTRMGFGALRVLNDDTIAPHTGFPPHPHRDMEIITIVMRGAVTHVDSMGNRYKVSAGEVQVMSAGLGVTHAETNDENEPLELFQLWILPREKNQPPRYAQKAFDGDGQLLLVSPDGREGSLSIGQEAFITKQNIAAGNAYMYPLYSKGNGVYVFMVKGRARVADENLQAKDGLGMWDTESVGIEAKEDTEVLFIEVPLH